MGDQDFCLWGENYSASTLAQQGDAHFFLQECKLLGYGRGAVIECFSNVGQGASKLDLTQQTQASQIEHRHLTIVK
jgi:hypothetical protein